MKKPWQMAYLEWVERDCPVENLRWAPIKIKQSPFFRTGRQWEINAIKDFFRLLPKNAWRKGIIGPKEYLPHRNKTFANSEWIIQTHSTIVRIEDAREAIILGRLLGYKEEDIAFYLIQNYIPAIRNEIKGFI
jgi:hypothetical protein